MARNKNMEFTNTEYRVVEYNNGIYGVQSLTYCGSDWEWSTVDTYKSLDKAREYINARTIKRIVE